MLCEKCKIREANIQYTEVINGVKTEHNFCAQCAKDLDFGQYSAIFDGGMPLGKILSGLLGLENNTTQNDKMYQVVCPTCKTSYKEFIENSRFGCADCYSVFDLLVSDNIKQMQGGENHIGKKPRYQKIRTGLRTDLQQEAECSENAPQDKMSDLKKLLKEAIETEEYEKAAKIRDQIKQLKEGKD